MEKTLKHELYKHGSYLHSLKEVGSEFVNIDDEIKKNEELFQMASKKEDPMTKKTMLQQIGSLAQAAVNADDDQEQFSNLMRIIELTEADNQNFVVGEYYSYKSLENVLHILKIAAVMGDIVEAAFLDTKTGKLINTRIELDKKYVQPATVEQIAEFKKAKIKNDIDFIINDGDGDWIEIVENIQDYLQSTEEKNEI